MAACGPLRDQELVDRVAAGDDTALAEVYDTYSPLVFGLARRITNDRSLAEDVTQDVFVSLWRQPERFDPARGSLRALLASMARNRAIDLVRSHAASRRRDDEDGRRSVGVGHDVEEAALRQDTASAVRRALDALPADQREAIDLAYFGGHTYREVATLLGIPEGTAKSRLRLGMQRLGSTLRADGVLAWT